MMKAMLHYPQTRPLSWHTWGFCTKRILFTHHLYLVTYRQYAQRILARATKTLCACLLYGTSLAHFGALTMPVVH